MGITTTTVSITSFRKFIPEVIIPSSVTAYEGRESRFAIITKNRGSLEGILHIELKPLDVELFENIYFTSKKYFRNDRAKLDVFLKPGETKYVVVSVIPPFNKTYTVNVTWNAHAFSDSKQLIIDVKKLSSREKKEDLPGMEFPQFVLIILFSTIILMGSLIE